MSIRVSIYAVGFLILILALPVLALSPIHAAGGTGNGVLDFTITSTTTITTTVQQAVPQFPAFGGLLLVVGIMVPLVLLLRKGIPSLKR